MPSIEARYTIVTPMFLGDANQQAGVLRPSSVKGALRFWWRAMRWGQVLGAAGGDTTAALRNLHASEARLFGAAASDSGHGGQGVFLLQVRTDKDKLDVRDQPFDRLGPGQLYLLGQGLGHFSSGCTREALAQGQEFSVLARFKPGAAAADVADIAQVLEVFGLLGALGSRARHGMGSVSLKNLRVNDVAHPAPDSLQAYGQRLQALIRPTASAGLPPFTAFSKYTHVDVSCLHEDSQRLLERLGQQQQLYRVWGRDGKVNGQESRKLFKHDHDLIYQAANGERVQEAPERAVFGLPHNYRLSAAQTKNVGVDAKLSINGVKTRRASPLLLHVHQLADQSFAAVHVLMPAVFLPAGGGIQIGRQRDLVAPKPKWGVINTYLAEYHKEPHYNNVIQGERIDG